GGEDCDDGNTVDTDGCHNDCTLPQCGDGIVDPNETCDPPGSPAGAHGIPCVTLNDVYGNNSVTLTKRKRLCNPADKNGEDPTAPSHPDHLLRYIIKPNQKQFTPVPNVKITNQFGTFTMTLVKPNLLMVPTAKNLTQPPSGPPVNPAVGHFKCYK